ncbi:MAG: AMP-binding protein, partial [Actinobacteria bacterium]|nr:AMP-binding protein [Actinomycetota bacterium]
MVTTSTMPLAVESARLRNVTDLLEARVRTFPDHVAFARRRDHGLEEVSTRTFCQEVHRLAAGLIARGVGVGDSIAVMSPTRYEWAVVEMAIWYAGGVVLPLYETSAPAQLAETFELLAPV